MQYNEYDNVLYLGNATNEYLYLIKAKSTNITGCMINENCKLIGCGAFYNCSSLRSITIPNSVISIRERAFEDCGSLTSVNYTGTIDEWVQIEFYDYDSNPLYYAKKLYINNELVTEAKITTATKINAYAFYGYLSLTSVTIGDSVTSIGEDAFWGCDKLVEVINKSGWNITRDLGHYPLNEKESGESEIVNKNGYLFYTDNSYYEKVNYLLGYVGSETNLTLPDSYNGESYEIYKYAFYNCDSLASVTIGSGVTYIGYSAFSGCRSLTSVTFKNPDGWHTYLDEKNVDLDFTDIVRNAIYLKKTYTYYYWHKV